MQHQKRICSTFTKDPIDDYKTYAVWKNISAQNIFCLLSLQRNQHLLSATVGLVGLLFATAKLHSVCKTFTLTHSNTEKYKFVNYSRNSVTISFTADYLWYYCTTKEILVLKQIDCNEYYKTNVASKDYIL